jgi:hypothetical protein
VLAFQHAGSGDVARQEIGSELDALERQCEEPRKALAKLGLAEPRQPFEQHVSACEDGGGDALDDDALVEQHLLERRFQGQDGLVGSLDFDGAQDLAHGHSHLGESK